MQRDRQGGKHGPAVGPPGHSPRTHDHKGRTHEQKYQEISECDVLETEPRVRVEERAGSTKQARHHEHPPTLEPDGKPHGNAQQKVQMAGGPHEAG